MDDQITKKLVLNGPLSAYASALTPEAKQRYYRKLLYDSETKTLPDPYSLGGKWSTNPSNWPDLTFGDIYLYLIDTPSIYNKDSMKAYKSLEAYKYVVSGHVQVVLSNPVDDKCPFIALKSKVTPSQRARDKPHEPWVFLEKNSGTVYCAHCTCMAGLGEVCSHVGALLFKIEMGVKMGMTQTSSTSKACQWNSTFRKEVAPTTITDIFQEIKGKRKKEIKTVQASGSAPLPPSEELHKLYALVPNASFFTSVSIPGLTDNLPTDHNLPCIQKYPKLLTTFSGTLLEDNSNFETYSISKQQAANLEIATRNQAVSPLWYQHRMGRVTASKAHDILTCRDTTSPDNLVRRIVGYVSYDLSKKEAVKWGIDHEDECRVAYSKHQTGSHVDFHCNPSGFVINTDHPFLGASPDGYIDCQCCGKGTLEIKCPFKHRDKTVQEAAATDKDFCLDSSMQLKANHRYYSQVQFQMYITKCQYCDFVVYTKCKPAPSMVIVRLSIDVDFCQSLIAKCEHFVNNFVKNELVSRKLENQPVVTSTHKEDNSDQTWCICAEVEYGRMIKCDNEDCPYQWFHYKCVNIRRKPRGKWFCASCDK
ncbi:uncharacterized protein LOC121387226 [Gigantopelta aegis]|uniref:uncharacterized protein LOC121387226 n=1 Tax=Gigantopelta aegis TaxID=1735272 RepID=UPI001B88B224|nr:uncharacterized protein LOC121387226 [Gigantopelta aegis]